MAANRRASPHETTDAGTETGHVRFLHPLHIQPSPENDQLYRPVRPDDPEVKALAASIREHGIKEPLVVSLDYFILSGHRRWTAARLAGLSTVPVRIENVYHDDPEFVVLLREYNRQRIKSSDELAREEIVTVNPSDARRSLARHRQAVCRSTESDQAIDIEGVVDRSKISPAKGEMLRACLAILEERRKFWPLTTRQVHYGLAEKPPLRHASKPDSRYRNEMRSYKDACDLILRARVEGLIPWNAIDDPTRPVIVWGVQKAVNTFVRQEIDTLFKGYYRDLQQSQPRHIEIVGEKNTIANIIRPVACEFCIPLTLGRGYCSGSPRKQMMERFRKSGRDALVLLTLSDFDPEGQDIPQAFARSLRDEFGIRNITLVPVGLTAQQVRELGLLPVMTAKVGSSRRKKFVEKHGESVHELEALHPDQMQLLLRDAITRVMDVDAYNREIAAEEEDAVALDRMRQIAVRAIRQQMD